MYDNSITTYIYSVYTLYKSIIYRKEADALILYPAAKPASFAHKKRFISGRFFPILIRPNVQEKTVREAPTCRYLKESVWLLLTRGNVFALHSYRVQQATACFTRGSLCLIIEMFVERVQ